MSILELSKDQYKVKETKKVRLDNDGSLSIAQLKKLGVPRLEPVDFSGASALELRAIQKDTFGEMFPRFRNGERKFVISAAAGSGKTILAIMLAKYFLKNNKKGYFVFCAHMKSLLEQTKEEFEKWLGCKVGIIQGATKLNLECQIQISMIQTIGNRFNSKDVFVANMFKNMNIQVLVVDECHLNFKATHGIIKGIETRFEGKDESYIIVGLSGTPFATFLAKIYGNKALIKVSNMHEQIAKGVIVDYHLKCHVEKIDTSRLKKNSLGEYDNKAVTEATEELIINGEPPAETWWEDDMTRGKYTLVFAQSIKEAQTIYDHFVDWAEETGNVCPSRIALLHSKLSDTETSTLRSECKNGDILIAVSVFQIAIGFDAPHFSVRINFRPFAPHPYIERAPNAMADYVQVCARTARKYDGGYRVINLTTGKSHMLKLEEKDCILAVDIDTGKYVTLHPDTTIDSKKYTVVQYNVVETLPKKEFAVHRDYTGIDQFVPPQAIDALFTELPHVISREEKKKLTDEAEERKLEQLENDADALAPNQLTCKCGTVYEPPTCPDCGHQTRKVMSDVIDGVEIVYKDGESYVAHIPKNWSAKLDKFKEKKTKEKKRKNVDYNNLLPEQKDKLMAGVIMTMADDGVATHAKSKSIQYARYISVAGKDQMETSGQGYAALKRRGANHVSYCYEQLEMGNHAPITEMRKFVDKIKKSGRK